MITKTQMYHNAVEKVKARAQRAQTIANQNYHKATLNPLFKQVDTNIISLNIAIAKAEVDNKDSSEYKKLLKKFLNERTKILKNMNMAENDLSPKYFCPKCNDTGYYKDNYCDCVKKIVNDEYSKLNNCILDPTQTFENSNDNLLSDDAKLAYKKIYSWCEKFPNNKIKNIVLQGGTGIGKTYLVNAICNKLSSRQFLIQYFTAFGLNNLFLKYHTCFDYDRQNMLDNLLDCDLLVIDDLGTENILKNVTIEYLYLILNERLIKNRSTIITTNLLPEAILDRYGERIFSRLINKQNSTLLKINGKDIRIKK